MPKPPFNIDEDLATSYVGKYVLYSTIGEGAFGKVKIAVHKETKQRVAIKIMEKKDIREQDFTSQVRREIYIMRHLQHKNIVRLHEVLTSETRLYIVMELVKGGELFDRVERGKVPEDEARRYFQQLIDGVDFCHKRGVAHRDLKPENLLVDEHGNIKITDFGFSSMKGRDVNAGLLYTQCGTPDYCAPEIIENAGQGYNGAKVDAWSCGIILYALLCGRLPFRQQDTEKLYDLILACKVTYPSHISPQVRDLLEHLLVKNPSERFDLASVKRHPWFLKDYEGDDARRIRKRPFYNKSQSEHSRSQSQSPVTGDHDASQPIIPGSPHPTSPTEKISTPTSTSAHEPATCTPLPATSTEPPREAELLHNQQPQEPILPADIPVRNTKYTGRPMPSVPRYTDYYGIYKPTSPADVGTHIRAPTPPTHAVITRVEDRPVTPARRQTSEKTAAAFKAAQEAADKHANVANSPRSLPVPPISPGYGGHSPAHAGNPVSSAMPPTGQRTVFGSRPPRSSLPYEGGLSHFEFPRHDNEDDSSSDQESVEDYPEKAPLRLELPSEPMDLLRSARGRSQQLPMARQQRHRSDLGATAASSGRMGAASPVDHGPASMSSVQLQRRGFAPAPNLTSLRVPLGSDVPNSPPVVYSPSGYDRYRSTSPGFNARIGLISDLHSPHGNNQPGITGFPSVWYSNGNGYASSKDDGGSSVGGGSIQNEIVARHLWNMVNKLRGTDHPAGKKLSDDLRQDFRILHSELNQMTRYEDSSVVLSNFLAMFETLGLSDGPGSSPGFGNQNRSRGTSDMDEEYDDGTTIESKEDYPSQGETRYNRRNGTDMSSDDVRATLARRGTDMSSEDEPRSWSPVIAETPRHQSDLAKRRHISDLLNRMIKKTGKVPGEQGDKQFLAAEDLEQPTSAADLAELQRLMREHHSGREEDKIAEDLLLLMDSNNNGGNDTTFGTKVKAGQSYSHTARSVESFPRFPNGNSSIKSSRPNGPLRTASGSNVHLPQHYVPGKFQEPNSMPVRGTNGGMTQNGRGEYRVIDHAEDLGETIEVAQRGREDMASSMGMHDVAYYGSDKKNGVANKLQKVLQNMKTKNHKLGERHAQFRSTLPPEVIMQLLGRILKDMGAMVTIKKETKRKMKCRLTIQPNWVLIAGIELCAIEEGVTLVAFRRSKQDKGRTDTESFHTFFERVRKRFIEEANVSCGQTRNTTAGRGRKQRGNDNSSRKFSGSTGHLALS